MITNRSLFIMSTIWQSKHALADKKPMLQQSNKDPIPKIEGNALTAFIS